MKFRSAFLCLALAAIGCAPPPDMGEEGGFQPSPPQTAMPTPVLEAKRTPIEKARFPVVDIHFHARSLDSEAGYAELLAEMDAVGVAALANMDGGRGRPIEEDLGLAATTDGRIATFARLDYEGLNDAGWSDREANRLQEAFAAGAAGLKMWKDVGLELKDSSGAYLHVDDSRFDAIWRVCAGAGKPVLMHVSDPPARFQPIGPANERYEAGMWRDSPEGSFHGTGVPMPDEIFEHREAMLTKHPETTFILAHVASMGWNLERVSALLEAHPNAVVEVSARLQELGRQPYTTRRFLIKYQARVLFGSDGAPGRDADGFWRPHWRFFETDDEYFDHPAQMLSPLGAPLQGRWKDPRRVPAGRGAAEALLRERVATGPGVEGRCRGRLKRSRSRRSSRQRFAILRIAKPSHDTPHPDPVVARRRRPVGRGSRRVGNDSRLARARR